MNKGLKRAMTIAVIAIAVGLVSGGVGYALGGMQSVSIGKDGIKLIDKAEEGRWVTVDETFDPAEVTKIVIDLDMIDNLIIRHGDSLNVTGKNREYNGGLTVALDAGVLTASSKKDKLVWSLFNLGDIGVPENKSNLTITLPDDTDISSVKIRLSFGDTKISDINADSLDVKSDSGRIDVAGALSKSVNIAADFGDIKVSDINAENLTIESDSGRIDASGLNLSDLLKIRSSFGDVTVDGSDICSLDIGSNSGEVNATNVSVSERLKIESDFGDVTISGLLSGKSTIESDSGEVKLTLRNAPDELSVSLHTDAGGVRLNGESKGGTYSADAKGENESKLTVNADFGGIRLDFK
jgi:DUF4097 and DUF4098 domain-containing protein YvlB